MTKRKTKLRDGTVWAGLSSAASFIDRCPDIVLRRAVAYTGHPDEIHLYSRPEGMIRYMKLKLGKKTRRERRYYVPDLTEWLNQKAALRNSKRAKPLYNEIQSSHAS